MNLLYSRSELGNVIRNLSHGQSLIREIPLGVEVIVHGIFDRVS